jgi:hypothetical protein
MGVEIKWEGLDELRTALRNLPEDLATQAASVVRAAADQAAMETRIAYPVRQTGLYPGPTRKSSWFPPGVLRGRVTVEDKSGQFSAKFKARSLAPHANLYENGGKFVRRNKKGANRGQMPAAPIEDRMIPKVIRIRARMVQQLIEIVKAAGFEVTT